jgi:hypothetical protein
MAPPRPRLLPWIAAMSNVAMAALIVGPPWIEEAQTDGGACQGPPFTFTPGASIASGLVLEPSINDPVQFPRGGEVAFAMVGVALNGATAADFNISICADKPVDANQPCGPTESFSWVTEAQGTFGSGYTRLVAGFPWPWFKFEYTPARGPNDYRWVVVK